MAERSLQIAHRNLLEIKQDSFFNIFKDRSFHCDVCNVCLDKWLEGRHSSRENSGHARIYKGFSPFLKFALALKLTSVFFTPT